MSSEVVAVDGRTARRPRRRCDYVATGERWRDLWVLRFADDGRVLRRSRSGRSRPTQD